MAMIREQAAKGELGKTVIAFTGRKIVSIDKLVEDPENERKTFDDMDDLVASIKASGVVEPLTVTDLGDGIYQIVTGHRRFRGAKLAGLAQLEVLIREPEEKWERRKKSLISNIQRADIRPLPLPERAVAFQPLTGGGGTSANAAIALRAKSGRSVHNPSTPSTISITMSAGSFTVHGTTRSPSAWASPICQAVRPRYSGAQTGTQSGLPSANASAATAAAVERSTEGLPAGAPSGCHQRSGAASVAASVSHASGTSGWVCRR